MDNKDLMNNFKIEQDNDGLKWNILPHGENVQSYFRQIFLKEKIRIETMLEFTSKKNFVAPSNGKEKWHFFVTIDDEIIHSSIHNTKGYNDWKKAAAACNKWLLKFSETTKKLATK